MHQGPATLANLPGGQAGNAARPVIPLTFVVEAGQLAGLGQGDEQGAVGEPEKQVDGGGTGVAVHGIPPPIHKRRVDDTDPNG